MSKNGLLATYLQDHLAGATVGVELARRAASSNRDSSYGRVLAELAREIEEDRDTLEKIIGDLDVGKDHLKVTLAWTGEKLGRLKLNGRLLSYSPLSRLEELELLSLGVEGKLLLWRALRETLEVRVAGVDLDELIKRARSQRRRLETQRLKAAAEAL
jgi:hypothetical protein